MLATHSYLANVTIGVNNIEPPRSAAVIWPTLLNPQTAPRIFGVYPQAFAAALADVKATEKTFWDLLFWYVGARTVPGVGTGGATQAGRLIIDSGRTLTSEEMAIVGRLLREGRTVRVLAESTAQNVRTADFIVDGVRTELKTISNLTSKDLSGALGRRILEGAGQARTSLPTSAGRLTSPGNSRPARSGVRSVPIRLPGSSRSGS